MSGKGHDSGGSLRWLLTYADMITLLLSFFVMLQTMAHTQDAKLMGISQQAFRRAISGMGMPDFLFGKQSHLDFEYQKLRHSTEEASTPNPGRWLEGGFRFAF